VNTSQIDRLEIELFSVKMMDFAVVEYISRFKNLKANILASGGKSKMNLEYNKIVFNNLSFAFK
jgi:hypothetical protein